MDKERANKIYDVLVELGGASERDRDSFVYHHTKEESEMPSEWRFGGKLGFGGKYWSERNWVTCYSEDEIWVEVGLIEKINERLSKI